jgi:outer membrane protein assembly factor BamB
MRSRLLACLGLLALAVVLLPARAEDWPQWQGVNRTAISPEKGLLQEWPKDGPPLAWKVTGLGGGYSTPTVAAGRIYGMGYQSDNEVVWALDEKAEGKEVWRVTIAQAAKNVGYPEGSRCSPTVDGDRIYVEGVDGDVVCLQVADGKEVWHKNIRTEFKAGRPGWGYSESPLIDGDKVIVTPGGKDATMVAYNKKNGELIWKAAVPQNDAAHYSSAIIAEVSGVRQYIQFTNKGVVSVAATDGKFLWRYDHPHNGTANCSTPIYFDGQIFAASAYGTGGGAAKLTKDTDSWKADEVWFTKKIENHHGGVVLIDGYLYGSNQGLLTCLDWKTGEVKWDSRAPGKGSIAFADGRIYYRNEGEGSISLVEATPEKYVEKGKFKQPERSNKNAWAHPVIANGKLYLRDQDLMLCYDIKQK